MSTHQLYLEATLHAESADTAGESMFRMVRYLLDNFATTAEAVEAVQDVRVEGVPLGESIFGTHFAIVDATGDSAIIVLLDSQTVIHHGPGFNVMTNDPTFYWQITNLKQYTGFGGSREIPGNVKGADRFVRLAHYVSYLPEPETSEEGAASALSAINAVAVPFGAP